MSCVLDITISGLCLLARDEAKHQVHVLFPQTDKSFKGCDDQGGSPGSHVHKHVARLIYEKKYAPDGPHPVPEDLAGVAQEIGSRPASAKTSLGAAADSIADITAVTGARVEGNHLTDDPPTGALLSRLTLNAGGVTWYRPGVDWDFGRKEISMTPEVLWRIQYPADSLTLKVAGGRTKTLRAVDNRIAFQVFHVPLTEIPPGGTPSQPPHHGDAPPHFPAFYSLFTPIDPIVCPRYKESKLESDSPAILVSILGTSPYTCMLGGGG